jgi:hypothetical protein
VGFEPTIPAFERAKTVHALDRAATVMATEANQASQMNSFHSFIVKYVVLCPELVILIKMFRYFPQFLQADCN